jgi:hypothetical protein
MATIATSTNASPFAYPGNTLMDIRGTRLYAMVKTSTANTYQVFFEDSPWTAAWTAYTSTVRASIVDSGSILVGGDSLWWCYRTNESSQDRIYLRRLNLVTGVWQSEVLVSAVANGGVAGAVYGGIDFHLVGVPSGQIYVAIAAGITVGTQVGVTVLGVVYNASGVATVKPTLVSGNRQWLYTGTGRVGPSVDIEHYGDGHGSGTPHLWVAFGRDRLQMVKLAWQGAGWSGPVSAQELVPSGMAPREYTTARWDGQEWLMAVPNPTTTDTVLLVERNRANTSTITRQSPAHPTGVIRHVGLSYNKVTQDARVYAIGTSTTVLYYVDYVRATGLWTSWATVLATAVLGSTGQEWGVRRGSTGDARHDVYTAHATNALVHTGQALTYAPFTPTWVNTSGQAADVAATLPLVWTFADSDPGDTQGSFAISRQIGAATIAYFRASDSTWQPAEVQNTSATSSRTLAAAWGAGTDLPHTYRVKVWDAGGTPSGYSDALVVIASVVVNPAIVTPTPAQVLTGDSVTLTWTAAEQTAYRITLSITSGALLYDSGWVSGTVLTFTVPVTLLNGGAYTVTLETRNNEGLPSVAQTRSVTVSFLAPDTPTLVCTPVPASGWIAVAITNPTPTGGRPAVASNDVFRRAVGDTSDGVRVAAAAAASATVTDWWAVSGVAYEYRALADGVNGTSGFSAWTS